MKYLKSTLKDIEPEPADRSRYLKWYNAIPYDSMGDNSICIANKTFIFKLSDKFISQDNIWWKDSYDVSDNEKRIFEQINKLKRI